MDYKISLINYFLFYFIIVYSVFGYGLFFKKLIDSNNLFDLGFGGVYGVFFLVLYSYISHQFYYHNQVHNFIFISIGFLLYFFFFVSNVKFYYKDHLILILIIFFFFIFIFLAKNHDDFPYYHFAYTYFLTQYESTFGVGIFNHGFRTPSSLFYIASLFYLPVIKYYSFHFVAVLIMIISNFILIKKIILFYQNKNYNFIFYLSLLCLAFINIIFCRIGEHGTDRSAQILIFILLIEILLIINIKKYIKENYSKIFILIALIVSFKAFYIVYSIFVIYLLIFLLKKIPLKILILQNKHLYLSLILIIISLLVSYQNTGCFLYPIKESCFGNFFWSIPENEVLIMSNWYELWSKGGAGPNFRVPNPEIYVQGFNWVSNWVKVYFFNKVSDTILGILFICLVTFIIFFNKKQSNFQKPNYKILLVIILFLMSLWFIKHPALRYGGYVLLALLIFIPFSIILEKFFQKNILKKIIIYLILIFLISFTRNIYRINYEIKKYNFDLSNPKYIVTQDMFLITNKINLLILNFKDCKKNKNNCDYGKDYKTKMFWNKYAFFRSQ